MGQSRKKRRINDNERCMACLKAGRTCRIKDRSPGQKCRRCTRKDLPCLRIQLQTPSTSPESIPDEYPRLASPDGKTRQNMSIGDNRRLRPGSTASFPRETPSPPPPDYMDADEELSITVAEPVEETDGGSEDGYETAEEEEAQENSRGLPFRSQEEGSDVLENLSASSTALDEQVRIRIKQPIFPSKQTPLGKLTGTEASKPGSEVVKWTRKAYWLQHLKRLRDQVKDFDTEYRQILNESGDIIQTPMDRLEHNIQHLEAGCLQGLGAPLPQGEHMHVPYLTATLSGSLFFTHKEENPPPCSQQSDRNSVLSHRNMLGEVTSGMIKAGRFEIAAQLQECLLLTFSEEDASWFHQQCRMDLDKYRYLHSLLFSGLKRAPADHLPFVEHSDELIRVAISCRMFFESKDILDRSLIQIALANKRVDLGPLLVQSSMIFQHDGWGMSPLHVACMVGNVNAVRIMILRGAPLVDPVGVDSWLPWHFAAYSGNTDVVEVMLQYMGVGSAESLHADIQTGGGQTAIAIAARYGHKEVVQHLLDNGADPTIVDRFHRDALHRAVLWRQHDVVEYLFGRMGMQINLGPADPGGTLLHVLCDDLIQRGHEVEDDERMMELLLAEESIDVNAQNRHGETALHMAISHGTNKEHLVRMLLNCPRVSVDVPDDEGQTPIFLAVELESYDVVRLLLDTGMVDVDATDGNWDTIRAIARRKNFMQIWDVIEDYRRTQRPVKRASRKRKRATSGPETSESGSSSVSSSSSSGVPTPSSFGASESKSSGA
ncbi:ankyrin repeat-containing domain protein [Coniochaeta sp. 2T2.1]|nr:ankyrin repeat-containing domain protein [Coniochaeta sp. 2T2.1]